MTLNGLRTVSIRRLSLSLDFFPELLFMNQAPLNISILIFVTRSRNWNVRSRLKSLLALPHRG